MKVCILGSGLTSLSLAKTLINQGLSVDLFSDFTKNIYSKLQTIGISKSNVNFFNSHILNIDKLLWRIKKINIYSENLKDEKILNFEENDANGECREDATQCDLPTSKTIAKMLG